MISNNKLLRISFFLIILLKAVSGTFYSALAPQITLHGRYYINDGVVAYDWTCFRIQFCFNSSKKVVWSVQDSWNNYQVIIDRNETNKIQPKYNTTVVVFESSQPETHCMEIVKITQNHYGPIASYKDSIFRGIEVEGGKLFRSSKTYSYKFQFLGDSLSTAFGVLGSRNPACMMKMKSIQTCLQSWAVHLSNKFDADYRIEAVSGKGVIKNAMGVTGKKMPKLFTQITDNTKPNTYNFQDHYGPDVLFIFIGGNDYGFNIIRPNPRKFIDGYKDMLQTFLHSQYMELKQGSIVINICDIGMIKELCQNVKTAVKQFGYGYDKVFYAQVPKGTLPKQNMGCIGHPNSKGQRAIAEALYPRVKEIIQSVNTKTMTEITEE